MEKNLQGKKILFIGVKFYDYNLLIQQKLEELGARVSFFYERDISIRYAIVDTFFPKLLNKFQAFHYQSILQKTNGKRFDYVFIIRGYKMPLSFIQTLKKRNPGITCIMYQWDSSVRNPFLYLIPEFDKVYSFDYKDVADNPTIKYLSNFYTDDIIKISSESVSTKYDFFYFGSYLPERYQGLIKFKNYAESNGFNLKMHLYMSYKYYVRERIKGTKLDKQFISFKIMKRKEYLQLLGESNAIVDVSNRVQTGLSMRVIEALGAGKKILTTNKWIIKEASFNPIQIAVIDIDNINLPLNFLENNIKHIQTDYSLYKWIEKVFGLEPA